jgi:ABC-type proline/glycine betaine transport system ATPase subunit
LELSTKHFKRALKKEKNTINQLNLIYNLKLKGSNKKANKSLEKLKLNRANLSDYENEIINKIE